MRNLLRPSGWITGREPLIACILAALVALTISVLVIRSGDTVRSLDEPDFMMIAETLVETGTFAIEPDKPTAYRAPGLVFLIAPVVALGAGLMEARLTGGVLVGLGMLLLFDLVRRHAGALSGLLSVTMVMTWPVVIYTATTLYPQTLAALLLVLTLWLLDRLRDGDATGLWPAFWGGLAFGAFILTIPVTLLLVPVFLGWIVALSRRWLVSVLIFCLVSGSVVGSWTLRNWLAFDAFVPVATSSGFNLLAGNSPDTRWNTSLDVRFPEQVYTDITGKDEVERNKIMTRAALDRIEADPGRFVALWAAKFVHWFHFSNRLLSDEVLEDGASSVPVDTRETILLLAWSILIVGPLLARIAMWRRHPPSKLEILFIILWIAGGAAYALFFTRIRFRLPFDWLMISANAVFLSGLINARMAR